MKDFLKNLAIMALAVFAPIQGTLVTVFILILADLIFGIFAAHKRKETITSAGIRRTVTKLLVYEITIMLCFLTETYLIDGLLPITKMVAGVVGMVEIKSIIEHVNEVHGSNIFKDIILKLGSTNDPKAGKSDSE